MNFFRIIILESNRLFITHFNLSYNNRLLVNIAKDFFSPDECFLTIHLINHLKVIVIFKAVVFPSRAIFGKYKVIF